METDQSKLKEKSNGYKIVFLKFKINYNMVKLEQIADFLDKIYLFIKNIFLLNYFLCDGFVLVF